MIEKAFADGFRRSGAVSAGPDCEAVMGMLNIRSSRLGSPDGHSDRVAVYALAIGKRMDLAEKELQTLKLSAMLHDIGKVGISRSIVDKLGRLTEQEFEIMRLHSDIAVRMLENVEGMKDCIPLIRHHHERFDGKGYPEGLSGHDIPLGSRIISVAETFDILVSDVPWRRPLTIEGALEEIERCSGTQFDPVVVQCFMDVIAHKDVEIQGLAEDSETSKQGQKLQ